MVEKEDLLSKIEGGGGDQPLSKINDYTLHA